jgi:Tfp pilus assembly protein PilF
MLPRRRARDEGSHDFALRSNLVADDFEAHVALARAYLEMSLLDDASKMIAKALRIRPDSFEAHALQAEIETVRARRRDRLRLH